MGADSEAELLCKMPHFKSGGKDGVGWVWLRFESSSKHPELMIIMNIQYLYQDTMTVKRGDRVVRDAAVADIYLADVHTRTNLQCCFVSLNDRQNDIK